MWVGEVDGNIVGSPWVTNFQVYLVNTCAKYHNYIYGGKPKNIFNNNSGN